MILQKDVNTSKKFLSLYTEGSANRIIKTAHFPFIGLINKHHIVQQLFLILLQINATVLHSNNNKKDRREI